MINGKGTRARASEVASSQGISLNDVLGTRCCIPDCAVTVYEGAPLPICARHYLVIARDYEAQLFRSPSRDAPMPEVDTPARREYVYFIRFRDAIKIGVSHDVPRRLKELPWGEVLAVVPGSHWLERDWHRRFAGQRINGEWFKVTDGLLEAIKDAA